MKMVCQKRFERLASPTRTERSSQVELQADTEKGHRCRFMTRLYGFEQKIPLPNYTHYSTSAWPYTKSSDRTRTDTCNDTEIWYPLQDSDL